MKLADWLDMWYKLYVKPKSKIGTHMQYETFIYQHINPRIGEIPLSKLTQEDIQTFLSNEKKTAGSPCAMSTARACPIPPSARWGSSSAPL